MNTYKIKLVGWLLVFPFFLGPLTISAYYTTNQAALKLTENTAIYTVTYKFGVGDRELYMPIMAAEDTAQTKTDYTALFSIVDEDDKPAVPSISNAIVLTSSKDVTIKDNQYYLKPNKTATFTLIALVTFKDNPQRDLSLLVTHLPFTMIVDGETFPNQLNPSELSHYRTPEIAW